MATVTNLRDLSILPERRVLPVRTRLELHRCLWRVSGPVRLEPTLPAAVLGGASAELRGRDVPEVDDLLADGEDHGNASHDDLRHLISMQRLTSFPDRAAYCPM